MICICIVCSIVFLCITHSIRFSKDHSQTVQSWKALIRIIHIQLLACTELQESRHVSDIIVQIEQFDRALELCQTLCCDHFPGEPVPVPNQHLDEEPFHNIQPKPS